MKSEKVKKLSIMMKLRLILLYISPIVLFFSYYPIIPIISTESTNYEFSLPLLWLLLFSILSLKDFFITLKNALKKKNPVVLSLLFPVYISLSAIWSQNHLRGLLTAGIFWCLIITGVSILTTFMKNPSFSRDKFLKIFLFSSVGFCIICWLQSILDVLNVGRETTLLCLGCTSRMFGFPHPSGFAIEPQFMGNLLLAPTLAAIYLWTKPKTEKLPLKRNTLMVLSFLFASTLFLTFSRGAIYAFGVGFVLLLVLNLAKLKNHTFLKSLPLIIASGVFVVLAQGIFSAVSYTDSTFLSGIEKSISQMTLGKVNLELEPKQSSETTPDETTESNDSPVFSGYVEESTNVRMNFNRIALELAPKTPMTLLFGYGLGSAGTAMYNEGRTAAPLEIIQNEPLSLLLETGLLGIILALFSLALILKFLKKLNRPERYLLWAILLSFALSLMFFSGLPNALHVYLFPVFLISSLPQPSSQKHLSR